MKAIRRNLRISPKKVNLVAGLVRGMQAEQAINLLSLTPKRAVRPLKELIKSAAANATNNFKQKKNTLVVQQIVVNEGATLKRFRPVSRGRAHPILKRTSHITVELGVQVGDLKKKSPKPEAPAESSAPETEAAPTAKKPAKKASASKPSKPRTTSKKTPSK